MRMIGPSGWPNHLQLAGMWVGLNGGGFGHPQKVWGWLDHPYLCQGGGSPPPMARGGCSVTPKGPNGCSLNHPQLVEIWWSATPKWLMAMVTTIPNLLSFLFCFFVLVF